MEQMTFLSSIAAHHSDISSNTHGAMSMSSSALASPPGPCAELAHPCCATVRPPPNSLLRYLLAPCPSAELDRLRLLARRPPPSSPVCCLLAPCPHQSSPVCCLLAPPDTPSPTSPPPRRLLRLHVGSAGRSSAHNVLDVGIFIALAPSNNSSDELHTVRPSHFLCCCHRAHMTQASTLRKETDAQDGLIHPILQGERSHIGGIFLCCDRSPLLLSLRQNTNKNGLIPSHRTSSHRVYWIKHTIS
jgi:hypothetical protein